jgi:hypothetical protein
MNGIDLTNMLNIQIANRRRKIPVIFGHQLHNVHVLFIGLRTKFEMSSKKTTRNELDLVHVIIYEWSYRFWYDCRRIMAMLAFVRCLLMRYHGHLKRAATTTLFVHMTRVYRVSQRRDRFKSNSYSKPNNTHLDTRTRRPISSMFVLYGNRSACPFVTT